jgi:hypothetical protein
VKARLKHKAARMPTRQGERRLTINLPLGLWQQIEELAEATHLKMATCARMLIVEALATRDLHPKIPPPRAPRPSHAGRRHTKRSTDKSRHSAT